MDGLLGNFTPKPLRKLTGSVLGIRTQQKKEAIYERACGASQVTEAAYMPSVSHNDVCVHFHLLQSTVLQNCLWNAVAACSSCLHFAMLKLPKNLPTYCILETVIKVLHQSALLAGSVRIHSLQ